jgi:hypothetical protein
LVQRGNNGKPEKTVEAEDAIAGARILTLVAKGLTITAASRQIGISDKHGRDLYARELSSVTEANNGLRQQLVSQDLETLRLLVEAHMPAALGSWVEECSPGQSVPRRIYQALPDANSAKIVLASLDRRSKLLGLDAAIRVEVSNAKVSEVVDGVVALVNDTLFEDDEPKALPPARRAARR